MGGSVIMQAGARSIYTSNIPVTLGESLNRIPGVKAEALILTPTTIRGEPIIVRGVSNPSAYKEWLVKGVVPREGAWVILGERAQRRLGLGIGEVLFLGSPLTQNIIPLPITGIYQTGDLRDYEAVIPLDMGFAVADRPVGVASTIQVEGLSPEEVEAILEKTHILKVDYEETSGQILILDSSANPAAFFNADGTGSRSLTLPFGYYTVAFQRSYITTNVTSLLLTEDMTVKVGRMTRDDLNLKVFTGVEAQPVLELEDGRLVKGEWKDECWAFKAPSGLHTLRLGDSNYSLPLIGDTIFSPQREDTPLYEAEIRVCWQDGSPADDYLLAVWSADGTLTTSARSLKASTRLALAEGEYRLDIYKPPYTVQTTVKIPQKEALTLKLPVLPSFFSVSPALLGQIKALAPLDASSLTLSSLLGVTASALTALTLTLALLSIAAVLAVYRGLHSSCADNLRILRSLGAGRLRTLRILGPTTLLITLALSVLSMVINVIMYQTFGLDLRLTILGYGLAYPTHYAMVYTLLVGFVSWLISTTKIILIR